MGDKKMLYEQSYGIIPLKKLRGAWHLLLVKHDAGHWSFPKGGAEAGEDHLQTATRELFEETGLSIACMVDCEPLTEKYLFSRGEHLVNKVVTYFMAKVKGKVKVQQEEIADAAWIRVSEASQFASFPEAKRLCEEIERNICLR